MSRSSLSMIRTLIQPLYEFLYPPACLACDAFLDETTSKICPSCFGSIRPIAMDDELYCEMRMRLTSGGHVSGLASAFHFEKQGTLQTLIHELKYMEMTVNGVELGKFTGEAVLKKLAGIELDAAIPVPLHPAKRRERGYNQSEYIAKGISRVTGLRLLPDAIQRVRNTRSQTSLTLEERKENVDGAFSISQKQIGSIRGKNLLLVDDVITTGATIIEAARVLKSHGAGDVYAASIALADHAQDVPGQASGGISTV